MENEESIKKYEKIKEQTNNPKKRKNVYKLYQELENNKLNFIISYIVLIPF
jgi:hypothetical protein